MEFIPKDIVRLILLYLDVPSVRRVSQCFRLQLSDTWWEQYFHMRIPSRWHPQLPPITYEYMKWRGHSVLRRIQEEGAWILCLVWMLSWSRIGRVFCRLHDSNVYKPSRITFLEKSMPPNGHFSFTVIFLTRSGIQVRRGVYETRTEYKIYEGLTYDFDKLHNVVMDIVLNGGKNCLPSGPGVEYVYEVDVISSGVRVLNLRPTKS